MKVQTFRANAIIERVSTKSILNPLLWLCGMTDIFAIPAAYYSTGGERIFFDCLATAPLVASMIAYYIMLFRDPDRVQSEDYRLAQQQISQGSKEHADLPASAPTTLRPSKPLSIDDMNAPDELTMSLPADVSKVEVQ